VSKWSWKDPAYLRAVSRHRNAAMVRVSSILGWSPEKNWSHRLCGWRNHDLAARRMDLSRMGGF